MDTQRSFIASVVLLLFAIVALLLLTVHVDEIQEPPQYMVTSYFSHFRSGLMSFFHFSRTFSLVLLFLLKAFSLSDF